VRHQYAKTQELAHWSVKNATNLIRKDIKQSAPVRQQFRALGVLVILRGGLISITDVLIFSHFLLAPANGLRYPPRIISAARRTFEVPHEITFLYLRRRLVRVRGGRRWSE
jgi:hypothetical protein